MTWFNTFKNSPRKRGEPDHISDQKNHAMQAAEQCEALAKEEDEQAGR
jgi:hypothetical protein